ILTCCVQWFCTEQPGSSSSQVPAGSPGSSCQSDASTASSLLWGYPQLRVSIHTGSLANEEAETHDSRGCHSHSWIAMRLR
ncbi:unnamed protein product, partial [Staurois parvus]